MLRRSQVIASLQGDKVPPKAVGHAKGTYPAPRLPSPCREPGGGQPELEQLPKRRSGKQGGGGRRKKGDPHRLLNVDVDPMESDPGDVGRWASCGV